MSPRTERDGGTRERAATAARSRVQTLTCNVRRPTLRCRSRICWPRSRACAATRACLTGDVNRADDLVQDTLARAWEKRRLWAAGSDLRAWLFTIMHNVFVNQRALARRDQMHVSLDEAARAARRGKFRCAPDSTRGSS